MKITTLAPDASGLVEWPTLSANRKSVVTVGVFDGMHRGHQAVIRRAVELAKADKAFSVVVMFDPRPGVVHAYAAAHDGQEPGDGFCDPMALTSVDQRLRTLENLGVDHVLIVRYTLAFATKSYRFFLGQMVGKLGMRTLVLGTDAAMGANRAGDVKAIGVLAQATGVFELEIVDDRGPSCARAGRRHPADAERAWGACGSDRRHDQGAAARVEQEASGARSARVELDERAIPARTWSYQGRRRDPRPCARHRGNGGARRGARPHNRFPDGEPGEHD